MANKLILHILSGILGIFLAAKFVSGVDFYGTVKMLLIIGTVLGLINFFIKPILKAISLPIRILTLGFFSLVINMGMIWLVDIFFPANIFEIRGLIPLFWTTLIVWFLNFLLGAYKK